MFPIGSNVLVVSGLIATPALVRHVDTESHGGEEYAVTPVGTDWLIWVQWSRVYADTPKQRAAFIMAGMEIEGGE